jgi:hypothetical protein
LLDVIRYTYGYDHIFSIADPFPDLPSTVFWEPARLYTHYEKLPDYAYPGNFLPGLLKKKVIMLVKISFWAAFWEISDCQKALFWQIPRQLPGFFAYNPGRLQSGLHYIPGILTFWAEFYNPVTTHDTITGVILLNLIPPY